MKDSIVWADLAENLKGAGNIHSGLCNALFKLYLIGAIDGAQLGRMERQLYQQRRLLAGAMDKAFFWKPGRVAPRVAACRKLARLAAKAGR